MTVATFTPKTNIQGAPYMQADPAGEYMRVADHQAVAAQLETLQAQLSTAQSTAAFLEKKAYAAIKAAADAEV